MAGYAGVLLTAMALVPSGALAQNGVWFWGDTYGSNYGIGWNPIGIVPVHVNSLSGVGAVAAGANHNLALQSNGTVKSWGDNSHGQLGDGTITDRVDPVLVKNLTAVVAIAGGGQHSLFLRTDGTLWGCGNNAQGQLANPLQDIVRNVVQLQGINNVVAVAGGFWHSMALRSDGTVWTWGHNTYGQLGNGSFNYSNNVPAQVPGLSNITAIACGAYHSLAVRSDGTVWAWGHNSDGQLGNGGYADSATPVQVSGIGAAVKIAGGTTHSLVLLSDGTVWSWGQNNRGQLGNGAVATTEPDSSPSPVQVSGLSNATAIGAGGELSVALLQDGTVWSWGDASLLGTGLDNYSSPHAATTPVQVHVVSGVTAISVNTSHTLAIGTYGTADTTIMVPTAAGRTGDTVTISAILTRTSNGDPLPGQSLLFYLGKNVLGTAFTNSSGVASGSYHISPSAPAPSTQTITVKYGGDANYRVSTGTGTLTIDVNAALTLTAGPSSPQYAQNVTATAKLTSGTKPVSGKSVHFLLDGVEVATSPVTTDGTGKAVCVFPAPHPGTHQVTASFDGSAPYPAASAGPVTITVKKASVKLTGESKSAPAGSSVNIGAVLTRTIDGAPLAGKTISFKVGTSTYNATTDGSGRASINVTAPAAGKTTNIAVKFATDTDYNAGSGTASVTGT